MFDLRAALSNYPGRVKSVICTGDWTETGLIWLWNKVCNMRMMQLSLRSVTRRSWYISSDNIQINNCMVNTFLQFDSGILKYINSHF